MMASRAVLLLMLVSAITANASDVVVTDCEACHGYATCHLQGVTPECRCKAGFVGDGLACYNRTACESSQDCCEPGYRWSSEQGCVDVDECSSSEQKCPQHLVCENTPGSFDCLLPLEESSHQRSKRSANPNAVFFSCGGQLCPGGEDCIDNNGYQQCLDPCQHYSVLNDSWRATDFSPSAKTAP
ncbi:hypothetical protein AGOR_G00196950 [Albula goreensis]|uniref:EGF-like domain-containing protein n=1 Tax=Albula goreensis TaxID=1534307 RepID=A0A8T3CRX3_9TELE|nr:hypothetical protein AGOR_G00196950 [Albula goreensis]